MSKEIQRENWKEYFAGLTAKHADFETVVQVLSDASGAQILSRGLPFVGISFCENEDKVELIVGSGIENHQTHNIFSPKIVAFESFDERSAGTLDIEEEDGTKTLIKFTQSLPAVIEHSEHESISMVSKTA